jgi:hypothetical protein
MLSDSAPSVFGAHGGITSRGIFALSATTDSRRRNHFSGNFRAVRDNRFPTKVDRLLGEFGAFRPRRFTFNRRRGRPPGHVGPFSTKIFPCLTGLLEARSKLDGARVGIRKVGRQVRERTLALQSGALSSGKAHRAASRPYSLLLAEPFIKVHLFFSQTSREGKLPLPVSSGIHFAVLDGAPPLQSFM